MGQLSVTPFATQEQNGPSEIGEIRVFLLFLSTLLFIRYSSVEESSFLPFCVVIIKVHLRYPANI